MARLRGRSGAARAQAGGGRLADGVRFVRARDRPSLGRVTGDPEMLGLRVIAALAVAFAATPAFAHAGHKHGLAWTLDPLLTVPLALALLIYVVGRTRLSKHASNPPSGAALYLSGWA